MGIVAETVRTWPGAVRSPHPQTSFAAIGARAAELMARHDLDSELGDDSPVGALEAAGGYALLLGVGYDRCTVFHLAEYRLPWRLPRDNSCVVMTPDGPTWVTFQGLCLDASDFEELGRDFERQSNVVTTGPVGEATARLIPVASSVAYATRWLTKRGRPVNRTLEVRQMEHPDRG